MGRQKPRSGAYNAARSRATVPAGPTQAHTRAASYGKLTADSISTPLLEAAAHDPGLAVRVSAFIPGLLKVAGNRAAAMLGPSSGSERGGGSSSMDSSSSGASNITGSAAEDDPDSMSCWNEVALWSTLAIGAICNTSRLPQQQVLDHFALPGAAAQHVRWMEDLATRILGLEAGLGQQQPGSSSSSTSSGTSSSSSSGSSSSRNKGGATPAAQVSARQRRPWYRLAENLLALWNNLQALHFQCLLAAAASQSDVSGTPVDASSSGSGGGTSSGSQQATSSGSVSSSSGSSSSQHPTAARCAPGKGGMPWEWMVSAGAADDISAVTLQSLAAWLRPDLVRLTHALLCVARTGDVPDVLSMRYNALKWAQVQRAAPTHPAVLQLGASGPAVTAAVAQLGSGYMAELQDMAWSFVATGSAALRQHLLARLRRRVPWMASLLHPTLQCCPSYHKEHSYAPGAVDAMAHDKWYSMLPGAFEVHLVGSEVWDLWPWQIEVLQEQQQQQQNEEQQGSGGGLPAAGRVSPAKHTAGQAQGHQHQQCSTSSQPAVRGRQLVCPGCGRTHGSNTIGSSNAGADTSASRPPAVCNTTHSSDHCGTGLMKTGPCQAFWPLLPYAAQPLLRSCVRDATSSSSSTSNNSQGSANTSAASSSAHQLPPVSADQLSMALERVCLNVQLSNLYASISLQLLVLLLLRADPALRLAFMQGPQGGLLLAALQLFGCGRTPLHAVVARLEPGLVGGGGFGWLCSQGLGLDGVQEVMALTDNNYTSLPEASTACLALSWLLLQPQEEAGTSCDSSTVGGSGNACYHGSNSHPGSSGSSSSSVGSGTVSGSCQPGSAWSLGPLVRFGSLGHGSGGLPLIQVPAAALQLLPGYTPHLQLAATMETLLLQGGDPSLLLGALADAYQQDPSRAPPPGSPMWLALASMAVAVRKRAAALVVGQSCSGKLVTTTHGLRSLLPLLRLAITAQQQPGAGWGALVLGSAVEGAALSCCAAGVSAPAVSATILSKLQIQDLSLKGGITRALIERHVAVLRGAHQSVLTGVGRSHGMHPLAAGGDRTPVESSVALVAILAAAHAAVIQPKRRSLPAAGVTQVLGQVPDQGANGAPTPLGLRDLLLEARGLLAALSSTIHGAQATAGCGHPSPPAPGPSAAAAAAATSSGIPTPQTTASAVAESTTSGPSVSAAQPEPFSDVPPATAATIRAVYTQLAAENSGGNGDAADVGSLHHVYDALDVCEAASACVELCSSNRLQLLGCANLSCITPPAAGLGGCEASLVVNCRGSVCGGCGVVRYCSAACAQQDWPGHRRVCRRLAAARQLRKTADQGDVSH